MNLSVPSFRLYNRRALVIGASRGIGLAIAQAFSQMRAQVTLCGRSRPALEREAAKLVVAGFKPEHGFRTGAPLGLDGACCSRFSR